MEPHADGTKAISASCVKEEIYAEIAVVERYLEKVKQKYHAVKDALLGTGKSEEQIAELKVSQDFWANECSNLNKLVNALKDRL
jgi:hypothetical protein